VESGVRSLRVAPKAPLALSEARLEGRSEVTQQVTAVDGLGLKVGDSSKVTYTFKPSCASGPCDTTLSFGVSGIFPGLTTSVTVPLARTGAGYAGSGPATLSKCGIFGIKGTLEVQLEVSGGAWVGSTWRATGVVGHERYSTPEATGSGFGQKCPPASWEADLTGTLSGAGQLSVGATSASGVAPAGG
jgi:hypothetical protein